jgi:BirA family biotin operon repressor/biotin-[acetyl-CoA-carboxylase] ligase
MPDPLPGELRRALLASAACRGHFGEPVYFFTETNSTNDVAAGLAEQGATEGTTVIALAQTGGRGRLGRQWFSPPGAGLYVSVVCRSRRAAPYLTLAGGVAVADGIRNATGLPVAIKWPNDIVLADGPPADLRRKLAGILAEASSNREGVQHVVLGFGINVQPAAYPQEIASRATSLEAELGRPVEAGEVLTAVLAALNDAIIALAEGRHAPVLQRWRELSPSSAGAQVEWSANGRHHCGTTAGIDDTGALLIRTDGRIERVIAGELHWP